jgi:hypothetical protein
MEWNKIDPNAPSERADFIRTWILSLYSEIFKQGKERLAYQISNGNFAFCCLGVAAALAPLPATVLHYYSDGSRSINFDRTGSYLPEKISSWLGSLDNVGVTKNTLKEKMGLDFANKLKSTNGIDLSYGGVIALATLNDKGVTFKDIAKIIQGCCKEIFPNLTEEDAKYIQSVDFDDKSNY